MLCSWSPTFFELDLHFFSWVLRFFLSDLSLLLFFFPLISFILDRILVWFGFFVAHFLPLFQIIFGRIGAFFFPDRIMLVVFFHLYSPIWTYLLILFTNFFFRDLTLIERCSFRLFILPFIHHYQVLLINSSCLIV